MSPEVIKDFIGTVDKMRQHQKAYFSKRQQSDLQNAKFYEQRIDAYLKKFKNDDGQQALFS